MHAVVLSVVALVSAVVTATIQSWLNSRAKTIGELRAERLVAYPAAWERTGALSRWPRTDITGDQLNELHQEFRKWYFSVGGLYMSENARAQYGHMQQLIGLFLARSTDWQAQIESGAYAALQAACSAFRTGLTEDLESRRRASLSWVVQRSWNHRKTARDARERETLEWFAVGSRALPEDDERQRLQLGSGPPSITHPPLTAPGRDSVR